MISPSSPQQTLSPKRPRIWAVGGGKGGVGKSVIATNLGVAVAKLGLRCILVDADLGGANLHTMVGVSAPKATLASIFNRESPALGDVVTPTGISNLGLISSAQALLDMANPKHTQKLKLIRQLFALNADVVLLDLSAGSSHNVVDFFNAAHDPILVVVPTPTSIENAYHFLNAALHRRLMQALARVEMTELAKEALADKRSKGIRTPKELVRYLCREAPDAGSAIGAMMAALRPKLIVNQIRREEDMHLGDQIADACRDFFGVRLEHLGGIRNDDRVISSIMERKPLQATHPGCQFSTLIEGMALRLIKQDREVQHE